VTTPAAEMTEACINTLLTLPDIFDFQGQIFIFHIFVCLSTERGMGQGTCGICY